MRGAIVTSFEPPIFHPVLDAYYAGDMETAELLEACVLRPIIIKFLAD